MRRRKWQKIRQNRKFIDKKPENPLFLLQEMSYNIIYWISFLLWPLFTPDQEKTYCFFYGN